MNHITIRPVASSDATTLSALAQRAKAVWGYDAAFLAACRDELTWQPATLAATTGRAAICDGQIVGFHLLEPLAPGRMDLAALFVDPDHLGCGLGRLLFRDATALARGQGARVLEIQADPHALAFYQAMGAEQVAETASGSIPGRMLPQLEYAL